MPIVLRSGQRLTKSKWQAVIDGVTSDANRARRIKCLSYPSFLRPRNGNNLALKAAYVILNSGFRYSVASRLWPSIKKALTAGTRVPLNHEFKRSAMKSIWQDRQRLFKEYSRVRGDDDPIVLWCETLPYIGPVIKYHLAMNVGADVCKPDVHLARLATHQNLTVPDLCCKLVSFEGHFIVDGERINVNRVCVVDRILWNALKDGILKLRC